MKKLIAQILVFGMLAAMLAGCAGAPADDTSKPIETEPAGSTAAKPEGNKEVTIQETVLFEEGGIKVTATGLNKGLSGMELKVLVENNSEKNIVFSADEFVINGVTLSGFGYVEAAAGKKANDTLTFYTAQLETAGIEIIASIRGADARIVDTDSYETLYAAPFSLTTSAADHVQQIDDSGDVIFQKDGVTVISRLLEDELYGKSVCLLVKNDTGKDMIVRADNVSVNGYTIDGWLYDTVYSDTVRYCGLDFLSSELEENEITRIEDVTFTLKIVDPETFDTVAQSDEIKVVVAE